MPADDAVVVRHHASGAPHRLANSGWINGAVVNAGDGTHEHPTQALLDAFTMRRRLGDGDVLGQDLSGRRVLIVHGDQDRVASIDKARTVARNLSRSTDVQFVVVPGGKHAMLAHGRDYDRRAAEFMATTLLSRV